MRRCWCAIGLAVLVGLVVPLGCGGDGDGDNGGGSTNPANVGNSCESDDDCETDRCYQGPEGGYCTTDCSKEGETENCPEDTVCKPIQGRQSTGARCLLVCGSESACDGQDACGDDFCPEGSSCVEVSDTDLRACEPNP